MTGETKRDACQQWLREHLQGGARPASEVIAAAKQTGFSYMTLRRAVDALGLLKEYTPAHWLWSLPPTTSEWCRYCGSTFQREQPRWREGHVEHGGPCPEHAREVAELREHARRRKLQAIEEHRRRVAEWEERESERLNAQQERRRALSEAERRDQRMRALGLDNPVPEAGRTR